MSKSIFPPIHQWFVIVLLVFLMGCSSAETTHTVIATPDVPEPTQTVVLPTETPSPLPTIELTATPTITHTPVPTSTNTPEPPLSVLGDGVSGWCLSQEASLALLEQPGTPPDNAKLGHFIDGNLNIDGLPVRACVFIYKFNKTAPEGTRLEIYDMNPGSPWLSVELSPVAEDPQSVAGKVTHSYIIEPPYWDISYIFVLKDNQGTEIQRDTVNLHRWKPGKCWNGQYPNLTTMRCPLQQDLHPWDIGYKTPLPTLTPGE